MASLFKEVRVFKEFPHPENPRKLLNNKNLAHPGLFLKKAGNTETEIPRKSQGVPGQSRENPMIFFALHVFGVLVFVGHTPAALKEKFIYIHT